ncbi:MAG: lipopolysaccharide kinase InaA family protein [Thermodesulfobacteriota bacterium]
MKAHSENYLPAIRKTTHGLYSFGFYEPLSAATLGAFVEIFQKGSYKASERLEGRAAPQFASSPETGPVVIKFYKRGGWMSRLNRDIYLRTLRVRSRREFECLAWAKKAGVSVPVPVAYASHGLLWYRAWLITREIPGHIPFVRFCVTQQEQSLRLIPEIARHIRLLINAGIHHVDLHPGNVLVDQDRRIYLIDFDKARIRSSAGQALARKYQRRWARAVRKYRLPDIFADLGLTEA